MHLWNTNAIAEKLKSGRVSEREQMQYLLCWSILVIFGQSTGNLSESFGIYAWLGPLLEVGVSIVAIILCYRVNAAGDNKDFLNRFVCVTVPEAVKIAVIGFALGFILNVIKKQIAPVGFIIISEAVGFSLVACFFFRVYRAIRWIASIEPSRPPKGSE